MVACVEIDKIKAQYTIFIVYTDIDVETLLY